MPPDVTEQDLRFAIAAAIGALPAADAAAADKVTSTVQEQFGGSADAALVKRLVAEALAAVSS